MSESIVPKFRLKPHPKIPRCDGPVLVIVLDGWGESKYRDDYNAIYKAKTPCLDSLRSDSNRWRLLKAHGTAVGLPSDADMGNSEVGHNALGSGQIIDQGAKCVDRALATGDIWNFPGWQYIKPNAVSGTLHLIGLLSDGGVHSRYDQLMLLINGAVQHENISRVRLHVLSDGRDVEEYSAVTWIKRLYNDLEALNTTYGCDAKIASGGGRMRVTMDRYGSDWEIVKRGWDAAVLGKAANAFVDPIQGVADLQHNNNSSNTSNNNNNNTQLISDQFIPPWVVVDPLSNLPIGTIQDGDAVVTFNFRADRMIQISQAFEYPPDAFDKFDRERWPSVRFAGMMQYDGELMLPSHFLVPPPRIENVSEQYLVLGEKIRAFACSESQKIGHMTFFWNGNRSGYFDENLEKYLEIPSDTGISFDIKPDMKAQEITRATKEALLSGNYDFVRCNFPNGDMVGHTGNLSATIMACSTVDMCVEELLKTVDVLGGRWLVTADHGNAEEMAQRNKNTGEVLKNRETGDVLVLTSHTLNPVPCAIGGCGLPAWVRFKLDSAVYDGRGSVGECESGEVKVPGLANVTATFINLLGFEAPEFYEPTLIE